MRIPSPLRSPPACERLLPPAGAGQPRRFLPPPPSPSRPKLRRSCRELAFQAAREGDTKTLEEYFAAKQPVNGKNKRGDTLLTVAAYNGQFAAVEVHPRLARRRGRCAQPHGADRADRGGISRARGHRQGVAQCRSGRQRGQPQRPDVADVRRPVRQTRRGRVPARSRGQPGRPGQVWQHPPEPGPDPGGRRSGGAATRRRWQSDKSNSKDK